METDIATILTSYIAAIIYIILGIYIAKWGMKNKKAIPNIVQVWGSVIFLIFGGIVLIMLKLLGID